MKYFTALADAAFARAAFLAAGIDFDAAIAAKNPNVIKDAVDASVKNADAESIIASAKSENDELKAKLETVTKSSGEKLAALVAVFDAQGFNVASATETTGTISSAKITEQKNQMVAKEARSMVAKAGHPGVLDEIPGNVTEPAKKKVVDDGKVTGADRLARDFNAQLKSGLKHPGRN